MNDFPFRLALNTSTLRPFELAVPDQIAVTAAAGFDGIELWVRDIEAYVDAGGSAADLANLTRDAGIDVVNGIAFFKWADSNPAARADGLEQARREIALLARVGCKAVAAPPTGDVATVTVDEFAVRFAALDRIATDAGVTAILEFWGRAPVLHSIGEAQTVLDRSGVDGASMLLDLFHMYTGGSSIDDVASLPRERVGLVHVNDYPSEPERAVIKDSDRVMPGDGVGGVARFYDALDAIGYRGYLSVELFRPSYSAADATGVARQALAKSRACWSGERRA